MLFFEPCAALCHRDACGLEFLLHPALSDPDHEPAVGPDQCRAYRGRTQARRGAAHVTVMGGTKDNPVYQVGGKSFVFFRQEPSTRRG
jgi:hypothetical protein